MISILQKRKLIYALYGMGFFFTLHFAMLEYINSSFLEKFTNLEAIGLIYIASSILSILVLGSMSKFISKFGNTHTALGLLAVSLVSLLGLAIFQIPILVISLFIIHYALNIVIRTNFDIDLEKISSVEEMGSIRGGYLTSANFGWLIAPLFAAVILINDNFWTMYLISSVFTLITMVLVWNTVHKKSELAHTCTPLWKTASTFWKNKNLTGVLMVRTLFNVYLSWFVIYLPIHLHQNLGFSWQTIGILLTLMLLPYVLLEWPLGKIADRWLGEKEMLITGFIIMSLAAVMIGILEDPIFLFWAGVLFLSRVGASFVESMSEIYFFKLIKPDDTNAVELFRDTDPLGYLIGPLLASLLLFTVSIPGLFIILGAITLIGIALTSRLEDTL